MNDLAADTKTADYQIQRHLHGYGQGMQYLYSPFFVDLAESHSVRLWTVEPGEAWRAPIQRCLKACNSLTTFHPVGGPVLTHGTNARFVDFDYFLADSNGRVPATSLRFDDQLSLSKFQIAADSDRPARKIETVTYSDQIAERLSPIRPLIEEVLDIVSEEARRSSIEVRNASVDLLTTTDGQAREEIVIRFFSSSERSKPVLFSTRLADLVAAWPERLSNLTARKLATQSLAPFLSLEQWYSREALAQLIGQSGQNVLSKILDLIRRVSRERRWPLFIVEILHVKDPEVQDWRYVLVRPIYNSTFDEADGYLHDLYGELDSLAESLTGEEQELMRRAFFFDVGIPVSAG